MRAAVATLLTFLALLSAPPVAEACRCRREPSPQRAMEQSDVVFLGRVLSVRRVNATVGSAVIRVQAVWRGAPGAAVTVSIDPDSPMCSFNFERGETYVVYGYRHRGRLHASKCSRTTELSGARRDLNALGAPRTGRLPRNLPEEGPDGDLPF